MTNKTTTVSADKRKAFGVSADVFRVLDRWRKAESAREGFRLSWNQFFRRICKTKVKDGGLPR